MEKLILSIFFVFAMLTIVLSGCSPVSTPIPPTFTPTPTHTPKPTSTPFVMPTGDFEMSWNIYNSEYNSLGGILTIRRQGSKYTQKLVMPDGSSETTKLTVISGGNEIRLTDRPGNSFGDYMYISSTGYLYFCDKQGIIYTVPPLK